MINLSLYEGIPISKEGGIKQFWEKVRLSKKKPFLFQKYIFLIQNKKGKYKGCWSIWTQDKKPKFSEVGEDKFKFIWKIDKNRVFENE